MLKYVECDIVSILICYLNDISKFIKLNFLEFLFLNMNMEFWP